MRYKPLKKGFLSMSFLTLAIRNDRLMLSVVIQLLLIAKESKS